MTKEKIDKLRSEVDTLCDNFRLSDDKDLFWTIEQFRKTYPDLVKHNMSQEKERIHAVLQAFLPTMACNDAPFNPVFSVYRVIMVRPRNLSSIFKEFLVNCLTERYNHEIQKVGRGDEYNLHSILEMGKELAKIAYSNKDSERVNVIISSMLEALEGQYDSLADIRGSSLLHKISMLSRNYGAQDVYERAKRILQDNASHVHESMENVETQMTISADVVDMLYNEIVAGKTTDQALTSFVFRYLPTDALIEEHIEKMRSQHILHMFTQVYYTQCGNIANIVDPDDIKSQDIHMYSNYIEYQSVFLHLVFMRGIQKGLFTEDSIMNYISQSDCLSEKRIGIIERGVTAFFEEDYVTAISILIPQVENLAREAYKAMGGCVIDNDNIGTTSNALGTMFKSFPVKFNDYDISKYLNIVLSERRGWNLRNTYCHGLSESFSFKNAERIMHILLLLSFITRNIN